VGLDKAPEPVAPEPEELVSEPSLGGILRHWMRRLTRGF